MWYCGLKTPIRYPSEPPMLAFKKTNNRWVPGYHKRHCYRIWQNRGHIYAFSHHGIRWSKKRPGKFQWAADAGKHVWGEWWSRWKINHRQDTYGFMFFYKFDLIIQHFFGYSNMMRNIFQLICSSFCIHQLLTPNGLFCFPWRCLFIFTVEVFLL